MSNHVTSTINIIRGKNIAGAASQADVDFLLNWIDDLEEFLDDRDEDDIFGTEGWRNRIGLDD